MALTASPPPQLTSVVDDNNMIDQLDDDIAKVRAEIAALTQRRSLLSASLLSSTKVQAYLRSQTPNHGSVAGVGDLSNATEEDNNPLNLLDQQSHHNSSNIHRLAFGVTSFPFTDPNPDTSDKPLIGIRFDVPSHNGKFEQAPYYIFCKEVAATTTTMMTTVSSRQSLKRLTVHHHTIPAFVPLEDLIDKYLPPVSSSSPTTTTQDHLSTENNYDDDDNNNNNTRGNEHDEGYNSISPPPSPRSPSSSQHRPLHGGNSEINDSDDADVDIDRHHRDADNTDKGINPDTSSPKQNLHGLVTEVYTHLLSHSKRKAAIRLLSSLPFSSSLSSSWSGLHPSLSTLAATGEDCRFIRLVWHDGLVGRVKIGDDGSIERTVVFGDDGRVKEVERLLSVDDAGDPVSLVHFGLRLETVAKKRGMATVAALTGDGQPDDHLMLDRNDDDDAEYETE